MIETESFRCGVGSVPSTASHIAPRTRNIKKVTIVSPIGETGCWIINGIGNGIESAVIQLSHLINIDSSGFKIDISNCVEVVPDGIKISDKDLKFIDIPNAILFVEMKTENEIRITKNKDWFSRIVKEATTNEAYYQWVIKRFDELGPAYDKVKADFNTAIEVLS